MAVYRQPPKCPYCGKVIAKPVYTKIEKYLPFYMQRYGDNFLSWEYKKHKCKKIKDKL